MNMCIPKLTSEDYFRTKNKENPISDIWVTFKATASRTVVDSNAEEQSCTINPSETRSHEQKPKATVNTI